MQKDLKDSIKARLYDFKYTPFLSSYIFSWIYFNSKLILIFTAPNLTVEKKIDMLSWSQVNYKMPLYFALLYVFIFPIATAIFYATTLCYKALMNKIQQLIQDKTPLPQEKANAIREENIKLTLEHRDIIEKIEKIKLEYSSKEKTLISQFTEKEKILNDEIILKKLEIDNEIHTTAENRVKELSDNLQNLAKRIEDKNNELIEKQNIIISLTTKISELEVKINELQPITEEDPLIDKAYKKAKKDNSYEIINLTIEQIKMLATFFKNDSKISEYEFKKYVNETFGLSKTLIELRIEELQKKDLVIIDSSRNYLIKEKGQKIIEKIFT